jgi:hypothetical protein
LTLVNKDILYNLSCILLLEHVYLTATAKHAACKVAAKEQLELELLKLAAVAVAAGPLLLALGLKVPVLRLAKQLLKGIL